MCSSGYLSKACFRKIKIKEFFQKYKMFNKNRPVKLPNPHLSTSKSDCLYHLDMQLGGGLDNIEQTFGDTKFVCMGGTKARMQSLMSELRETLDLDKTSSYEIDNDRYWGCKIGPVFSFSHGIGEASLSTLMHEVFKLLHAAKCSNVAFFRLGTCGGLGVTPGTVIISNSAISAGFKPVYHTCRLGEPLELPVVIDKTLLAELISFGEMEEFEVVSAKTLCVQDFYQGQGRLNGSFCDYTAADQKSFFDKLYKMGVRNMEMESAGFLAMCHATGFKAAVLCSALVDRMQGDNVTVTQEQIKEYEERPFKLVISFIKNKMHL